MASTAELSIFAGSMGRTDLLRCELQRGKDNRSCKAQRCGDGFPWLLTTAAAGTSPNTCGGHKDLATLLILSPWELELQPCLSCSSVFLTFPPRDCLCSLQSLPPIHNSNFLPIAQVQSLSVIPDLPLFPPFPGHTQPDQLAYKSQSLRGFFPSQI